MQACICQKVSILSQSWIFLVFFFSKQVLPEIVSFSNEYAWLHILGKQYDASADGSWSKIDITELKKLLGFLIYMGLVQVPRSEDYWGTSALYNGLWGRAFFPRDWYKALMAFLHVSSVDENANDRLCKVRFLYDSLHASFQAYYQPGSHVALDERMIRFQGRHAMKVYIRNNPTKWGIKCFAPCDSVSKYIWSFEFYTSQ